MVAYQWVPKKGGWVAIFRCWNWWKFRRMENQTASRCRRSIPYFPMLLLYVCEIIVLTKLQLTEVPFLWLTPNVVNQNLFFCLNPLLLKSQWCRWFSDQGAFRASVCNFSMRCSRTSFASKDWWNQWFSVVKSSLFAGLSSIFVKQKQVVRGLVLPLWFQYDVYRSFKKKRFLTAKLLVWFGGS